jgi:hypothetical protein
MLIIALGRRYCMNARKYFLFASVLSLTFVFVGFGYSAGRIALLSDRAKGSPKAARPQTPDYDFGSASFTKELWIDNKRVFKKPKGVDVEFITAGAFDWVFADGTGKEVRTLRHKNEHGGWTGMNFASLGLYGDYSIGFRNAASEEQQIKQGNVHFR